MNAILSTAVHTSVHELTEDDFVHAIRELDTFVDVTVDDLMELYQLARKYADIRYAENTAITNLMTHKPVITGPEKSLAEASRMFLIHNIDAIPVVDDNLYPLGIITEADVLTSIGLPCHHPACSLWHKLELIFKHHRHIQGLAGKVKDVMCAEPICIYEKTRMHDAIETMYRKHVKKLIVTDENGRVSGILTRSNVVRGFISTGLHEEGDW